ncbi:uncharacterized protein K452DRAFT_334717 [Aplosporella prunicola CBS 121167]|uniref:3'-5' exonuclease domain-containing protein n=1 Tax=Aplosporella prunicola CBS 121167 TaxID=1176127 RepID=A0A6A6AW78_9PEZI|nr:uncharacterized protein K452DRAFT_334717 [Aplosporella prunicola CBS 121167]KAF2135225.1 hypothetical protein K452DRAFT_334717 [Aplosporella prunicola CBS 121167]
MSSNTASSLPDVVEEKPKNKTLRFTVVDTTELLKSFLDRILMIPSPCAPSLYIDLEGVNLSRHGSISILQVLLLGEEHVYLIDIYRLGPQAFTTVGKNALSLRQVLESDTIAKAVFDVRNDSDALYHHYGIQLKRMHDIQLMEVATRRKGLSRKCVNGLAKCIEYDAGLSSAEKAGWKATKDTGTRLFLPAHGGSY